MDGETGYHRHSPLVQLVHDGKEILEAPALADADQCFLDGWSRRNTHRIPVQESALSFLGVKHAILEGVEYHSKDRLVIAEQRYRERRGGKPVREIVGAIHRIADPYVFV